MTNAPIETIVLDELVLRYRRSRRIGAPTVLITVAWPQSVAGFETLWPLLAAQRDVVAVELPGFGLSEGRDDVMRPSVQAEILVDFVEALGLRDVHVLALDVGVPATLFALARNGARFSGATLANGPGCSAARFSPSLTLLTRSALARSALALMPGLFVRVADHQGHRVVRTPRETLDDYVACHPRERLARTFAYLASYADLGELAALDGELARIDAPVSILWGTDDVYLPVENAHAIAARIPDAEVHLLSGVGHFSHDDAPETFARHVLSKTQTSALQGKNAP